MPIQPPREEHCAKCGTAVDVSRINDILVCGTCAENAQCSMCKTTIERASLCHADLLYLGTEMEEVRWACSGCRTHGLAVSCRGCRRTIPDYASRVSWLSGTHYCVQCANTGAFGWTCEACGQLNPLRRRTCGHCGVSQCPDIHEYSYKPVPLFIERSGRSNRVKRQVVPLPHHMYYGWELEVENVGRKKKTNTMARMVTNMGDGLWYLKTDSSLDDGFEIVSHPMSWSALRILRRKLMRLFATLRRNGFRSYHTASCGLHVHLSRNGFTGPHHLYRFTRLIYENHRMVFCVSERTREALADAASLTDVAGYNVSTKVADGWRHRNKGDWERHCAVNLLPDNTVEVRVFRGTLAIEGFFKALEFCDAAVQYSRSTPPDLLTEAAFVKWVREHKKEYPYLVLFLERKLSVAASA